LGFQIQEFGHGERIGLRIGERNTRERSKWFWFHSDGLITVASEKKKHAFDIEAKQRRNGDF